MTSIFNFMLNILIEYHHQKQQLPQGLDLKIRYAINKALGVQRILLIPVHHLFRNAF